MPYDRGGLTFLPNGNPAAASGAPVSWDLNQVAGAEALMAYQALTHGRVHSLLYSVTVATVFTTLPAIVAVHINEVESGLVTVAGAQALGTDRHVAVVPVVGRVLDFKPGDVIKLKIKQQPTGSGVAGGISPTLGVQLDLV